MDTRQTATPPSSQAANRADERSPICQVRVKRTANESDSTALVPLLSGREEATRTAKTPPSPQPDHHFQIKLIDLCTEHQGAYFKCEHLGEFWDMVATTLASDSPLPLSGGDVEGIVEDICREAKEHLLRGEIFPRRADREDLDMAIEDWLEIEGRRRLLRGVAEMRTGYLFAFGPEESSEENLLTHSCLNKLRETVDVIRTRTSDKGNASRRTSVLLIQKIESLTPKRGSTPARRRLTPEEFHGRISSQQGTALSPTPGTFRADTLVGRNGKAPGLQAARSDATSRALAESQDTYDGNGNLALPISPLPSKEPLTISTGPGIGHDDATETPGFAHTGPSPTPELTSAGRGWNPGPAVKLSALQPGPSKGLKRTRGRTGKDDGPPRDSPGEGGSRRNTNPSVPTGTTASLSASRAVAATAPNVGALDQQQAGFQDKSKNAHQQAGRRFAEPPAPVSPPTPPVTRKRAKVTKQPDSRKGRNKQSNAISQPSTPRKRAIDSPVLQDGLGDRAPQDQHGQPDQTPSGNVPIIDLTQSPDLGQVKRETLRTVGDPDRRLGRLTADARGVVGLTPQQIEEIFSRKFSDFEIRAMERLDQMREDWRAGRS